MLGNFAFPRPICNEPRMTFVFPILLGGLVLAGIPILLHLILRQKPKTLPFPAFRFLVQKHRSNLRKLQLRHLLLLILRITLIAALCLALAAPRCAASNRRCDCSIPQRAAKTRRFESCRGSCACSRIVRSLPGRAASANRCTISPTSCRRRSKACSSCAHPRGR